MKSTKEKIMSASIKLFEKKGYLETTTLEIAKEAGVAEVTLFRNFNSKLELFQESLRSSLSFYMDLDKIETILQLSTEAFYEKLLSNRVMIATKNKKLLRLIIKESFTDYLPKDLRFTDIIYKHVKEIIDKHLSFHNIKGDSERNARLIAGLLLSLVIIPGQPKQKIDEIISDYTKILI